MSRAKNQLDGNIQFGLAKLPKKGDFLTETVTETLFLLAFIISL